ncbi:hypothetical protein HZS_5455 [Henneguya salminicola]|nr:hypothetical protein HZS_5455 [Henneguya salminicola]
MFSHHEACAYNFFSQEILCSALIYVSCRSNLFSRHVKKGRCAKNFTGKLLDVFSNLFSQNYNFCSCNYGIGLLLVGRCKNRPDCLDLDDIKIDRDGLQLKSIRLWLARMNTTDSASVVCTNRIVRTLNCLKIKNSPITEPNYTRKEVN